MSADIVIGYADGRWKVVDPALYTSAEHFGPNALTELTIRLDDVSEGIYAEVSHHEPPAETDPQEDPAGRWSGRPYMLVHDCHFCLADAAEAEGVMRLEAGGRELLVRAFGEPVNVELLRAALCAADGDDSVLQARGVIAALYVAVPIVWERACSEEAGDEEAIAGVVARELGTTSAMVMRVRAMTAAEVPGDVGPEDDEEGFYDFG